MQVIHPARCIALPIYTRGTGHICIYSVYGHNQEQPQQLPQQTIEILDAISNHAKTHGKPYLIGGDFNATPCDIQSWTRQYMTQARIIHTNMVTCRPATGKHRTIDFFLISPVLADAIEDPKVDIQSPFRPHSPVELTFNRVCDIPWSRVTCPVASGSPTPTNGPHQTSENIWNTLHEKLLEQWGNHTRTSAQFTTWHDHGT